MVPVMSEQLYFTNVFVVKVVLVSSVEPVRSRTDHFNWLYCSSAFNLELSV